MAERTVQVPVSLMEKTRRLYAAQRWDTSDWDALLSQPTPSAEVEVERLQAELDESEQRENEMSAHLHPSWDGDEAQIVILMRFVEHAAKLDSIIEEAREADGWEGRDLTFVWHDDEPRLEWVPNDRLRAVIENAPHDLTKQHAWHGLDMTLCRCWKADAL